MSRSGFALLAVLWVITALVALVGLGLGATRLGDFESSNRLYLERDRWGADACLAIAEARWVAHHLADTATIDLGRGTTCRWWVDDPTAHLNINVVAPAILAGAAQAAGIPKATVESLLAHRPYQDTAQVRAVLRPDSSLLAVLTVDGPGTLNVNAAPSSVLLAIPGMSAEGVGRLTEYRHLGRPITSLDQLMSVTPGGRSTLLAHYAELSSLITFAPPQLVLTSVGWVGDAGASGLHATEEEVVVPLPDRLAVIRRRLW